MSTQITHTQNSYSTQLISCRAHFLSGFHSMTKFCTLKTLRYVSAPEGSEADGERKLPFCTKHRWGFVWCILLRLAGWWNKNCSDQKHSTGLRGKVWGMLRFWLKGAVDWLMLKMIFAFSHSRLFKSVTHSTFKYTVKDNLWICRLYSHFIILSITFIF